jgi:Zn-finger nucleic acid-binding protein
VIVMAVEKDRFGETMRLVERAKEDIYFAEHDRELLDKLRAQLQRKEGAGAELHCPKCNGVWESFPYEGFALDRCRDCGGVWMDRGELEAVVHKVSRGPLGAWIDKLTAKSD